MSSSNRACPRHQIQKSLTKCRVSLPIVSDDYIKRMIESDILVCIPRNKKLPIIVYNLSDSEVELSFDPEDTHPYNVSYDLGSGSNQMSDKGCNLWIRVINDEIWVIMCSTTKLSSKEEVEYSGCDTE